MIDNDLSRAELLIAQQRYLEADKVLMGILSQDPTNVRVLASLAEVSISLGNNEKATTFIDSAIGFRPDISHLYYIKARISIKEDNYDAAEEFLQRALEIDPDDSDYYALWATVKLTRKQYEGALELANRSLEFDAENILGLNARSSALLKLDRKEESFQTIEGALREDPNNAYTHANYGWNLLEKGQHKKALEHFREALKNSPDNEYAQAGMVQALKANNWFYRFFLQYTFWISKLTEKYQWGVVIGFYLGFKGLNALADSNEVLRPYLDPVIALLMLIAFSTWVITPVSNLFFRLNPYGKHLLDKKEIMSSNFVGLSFVVCLIGTVLYFLFSDQLFLMIAVFGLLMMLPYGSMFSAAKYKYSLLIYAIVMTLLGISAILMASATGEIFNGLTSLFIVGFVAFQWVANFLIIRQSNV